MDEIDKTMSLLVSERLSERQIASSVGLSQTAVRYRLKRMGLKTSPDRPYRCACGEADRLKFYGHKKNVCAKCHNAYTRTKAEENRAFVLSSLGGSCRACGFDRFPCSLDVHHLDSSRKDPKFHGSRNWSRERLQREIKTCVLLCKNCHAAVHAGLVSVGA